MLAKVLGCPGAQENDHEKGKNTRKQRVVRALKVRGGRGFRVDCVAARRNAQRFVGPAGVGPPGQPC